MKSLNVDEMSTWLLRSGWVSEILPFYPPKFSVPVKAYRGTCDAAGDVAADMAEIVLSELANANISGGLLVITAIFPPAPAAVRVFTYFLALHGIEGVDQNDYRFQFQDEPEALMAILTWCIACTWEFSFVSEGHRVAVTMDEEPDLTVYWAEEEAMHPKLDELLSNLEFKSIGDRPRSDGER